MITKQTSCDGKVKYSDRKHARIRLKRMKRQVGSNTLRAYKCPFCPSYHIGNMPLFVKMGVPATRTPGKEARDR